MITIEHIEEAFVTGVEWARDKHREGAPGVGRYVAEDFRGEVGIIEPERDALARLATLASELEWKRLDTPTPRRNGGG